MTEMTPAKFQLAGRDYPVQVAHGDHVVLTTFGQRVIVADMDGNQLDELTDRDLAVMIALTGHVQRRLLDAQSKRADAAP